MVKGKWRLMDISSVFPYHKSYRTAVSLGLQFCCVHSQGRKYIYIFSINYMATFLICMSRVYPKCLLKSWWHVIILYLQQVSCLKLRNTPNFVIAPVQFCGPIPVNEYLRSKGSDTYIYLVLFLYQSDR